MKSVPIIQDPSIDDSISFLIIFDITIYLNPKNRTIEQDQEESSVKSNEVDRVWSSQGL